MKNPDFNVANHGSIFLVRPNTPVARKHLEEHVGDEAQWWGGALAVEPRYVDDLAQRLAEEGFVVR